MEFHRLRDEIAQIVDLQVAKLIERVRERGVEVELTDLGADPDREPRLRPHPWRPPAQARDPEAARGQAGAEAARGRVRPRRSCEGDATTGSSCSSSRRVRSRRRGLARRLIARSCDARRNASMTTTARQQIATVIAAVPVVAVAVPLRADGSGAAQGGTRLPQGGELGDARPGRLHHPHRQPLLADAARQLLGLP